MKCARCGRNFLRLFTREFFDNRGMKREGRVCRDCAHAIDQHHEGRGSFLPDGNLSKGYNIPRHKRTDRRDDD